MRIRRKAFISICKKLIKKIDEKINTYESVNPESDNEAYLITVGIREMKTNRDILKHEYKLASRNNNVYYEMGSVVELIFSIYGVIKCDYDKI